MTGINRSSGGIKFQTDSSGNPNGIAGATFLSKTILRATRANAAAARSNRMLNAPFCPAPTHANSTVYTGGMKVRGQGANAVNLYLCVGTTTTVGDATQAAAITGTSSASGTGPGGTGIPGNAAVVSQSVTSITNSGTVATVTTPAAHGLTNGQYLNHSGNTPAAYNVANAVVTVIDATHYTYVMGSDPGGPATVVGTYIWHNLIADGTVVWSYYGKATSVGTIPLYSTVTPTTAKDAMDGMVAVIAAANYTALGLVPTVTSTGNQKFKVGGILPAAWGTFQGAPAGPLGSQTRPVYYTRPYIEVLTNSDTWLAIEPQANMTQYLQLVAIEVNDRFISESSYVSRTATAKNAYLLNLAPFGPGVKRVRVFYKGANAANGANLAYSVAVPADTFAYPPSDIDPIRMFFEGDSITQGIGLVSQIAPEDHVEVQLCGLLGFSDWYNGAVGGTGIVATGGNTNYPQRIADMIAYNPDIIYVGGVHNDNTGTGVASPSNQAAFLAYFQLLRTSCPNALIIINPYHVLRNESLTNAIATENDMLIAFNAWADAGSEFIRVLTAPTALESVLPGKFFVNMAPYSDNHPWPLFQKQRVGYENSAIRNAIANRA